MKVIAMNKTTNEVKLYNDIENVVLTTRFKNSEKTQYITLERYAGEDIDLPKEIWEVYKKII